ncbi:HNH endonuclease [Patescibacteria group bacterium]|nr:HNH endonuclease [Patescibacteria group bacterium]
MPRKRDTKTGKFKLHAGAYIDSKGYICICAGPQRGIRLHRLIAEAKLGRPLAKDEDCHHADGNKLNNAPKNIHVTGHKEHGCVSAKQHHVLNGLDIHLKEEWEEYFDEANGGGQCTVPVTS